METFPRTLLSHVLYQVGDQRWQVMNAALDLGRPARARDVWLVTPEKAVQLRAALEQRLVAGPLRDKDGQPVPAGGSVEVGLFVSQLAVPVAHDECPACGATAEVGVAGVSIDDNRTITLARCTQCAYFEQVDALGW